MARLLRAAAAAAMLPRLAKVLQEPYQSQFYPLILWIVSLAEQLGEIIEIN